jgi:hypothetical protein
MFWSFGDELPRPETAVYKHVKYKRKTTTIPEFVASRHIPADEEAVFFALVLPNCSCFFEQCGPPAIS